MEGGREGGGRDEGWMDGWMEGGRAGSEVWMDGWWWREGWKGGGMEDGWFGWICWMAGWWMVDDGCCAVLFAGLADGAGWLWRWWCGGRDGWWWMDGWLAWMWMLAGWMDGGVEAVEVVGWMDGWTDGKSTGIGKLARYRNVAILSKKGLQNRKFMCCQTYCKRWCFRQHWRNSALPHKLPL